MTIIMRNRTIFVIVTRRFFFVFLIMAFWGCGTATVDRYESRKANTNVDKDVVISKRIGRYNGVIEINFLKKNIPLRQNVIIKDFLWMRPYFFDIEITGLLKSGSVTVKVTHKTNEERVFWNTALNTGKISISSGFDFFENGFGILVLFKNAEAGKIALHYHIRAL